LKLIVGLGNPGPRYARNRHNVGYQCVERLAQEHDLLSGRIMFKAYITTGRIAGARVVLARPLTFMNLSGLAVRPLLRWFHIAPSDLLVICDDLDLPLGRIRMRAKGGAGGHKGVWSIIDALRTEDFARLRIGIGRPARGEPQAYVLSDFTADELPVIQDAYQQALAAVVSFVTVGIEAAMNRANVSSQVAD